MPTVVRIISYTGPHDKLDKQLAGSLHEGTHDKAVTISVVTLPSVFGLLQFVRGVWKAIRSGKRGY